jgi:hypothetical protein
MEQQPPYQQQPPYPPQPYPPQQPPKRNNIGLIIGIAAGVVLAVVLLCCGGILLLGALGNRVATTSQGNGNGTQTTSNRGPAKVGDTITVDGVGCTLVSAAVFHSDNQFEQPKAGNQFVRVNVKIHNGSAQQVSYNEFDFHAKSSAGNITTPAFVSSDNDLGSGDLAAGGTVSGNVTFEVPTGDHGAQLTWQPSFFGNSDANAWLLGV